MAQQAPESAVKQGKTARMAKLAGTVVWEN
jgi:hypothetical protein